jgi:hypothetical protein
MLETKIQELTSEVQGLKEVISILLEQLKHLQNLPSAQATASAPSTQALTPDELMDFAMDIRRADPSKTNAIRQTVADFGASVIADVHPDKLPALKLALEAL